MHVRGISRQRSALCERASTGSTVAGTVLRVSLQTLSRSTTASTACWVSASSSRTTSSTTMRSGSRSRCLATQSTGSRSSVDEDRRRHHITTVMNYLRLRSFAIIYAVMLSRLITKTKVPRRGRPKMTFLFSAEK